MVSGPRASISVTSSDSRLLGVLSPLVCWCQWAYAFKLHLHGECSISDLSAISSLARSMCVAVLWILYFTIILNFPNHTRVRVGILIFLLQNSVPRCLVPIYLLYFHLNIGNNSCYFYVQKSEHWTWHMQVFHSGCQT